MSFFATELGGLLIIVIVIIALTITDYISDYVDELEYQALLDENNNATINHLYLVTIDSYKKN